MSENNDSIGKGGAGSGQKGHTTTKQWVVHASDGRTGPSFTGKYHDSKESAQKHVKELKTKNPSHAHFIDEIEKSQEYQPSTPIYKAETRPYTEDINDLIEKGGVGSGSKGHTTSKVGPSKESQFAHNIGEAHRQMVETMNDANKKKRIDTSNPVHQVGSPEHKKFHQDAKANKIADQNVNNQKSSDEPKLMYKAEKRPYTEDINELVEKGWQQKSPKPGFSYASNKDQGTVTGVGGGKFKATDTQGKTSEQKYGNAEEAKNALDAKVEHVEKGGVGSGSKGHTTFNPTMNLADKLKHQKEQSKIHSAKTDELRAKIAHESNNGRHGGKEHKRLSAELQTHFRNSGMTMTSGSSEEKHSNALNKK